MFKGVNFFIVKPDKTAAARVLLADYLQFRISGFKHCSCLAQKLQIKYIGDNGQDSREYADNACNICHDSVSVEFAEDSVENVKSDCTPPDDHDHLADVHCFLLNNRVFKLSGKVDYCAAYEIGGKE